MLTCCIEMLFNALQTSVSDTAIHRYLEDTLGLRVELRPWEGASTLPYYLLERFEIRELTLLGQVAPDRETTGYPRGDEGFTDLRRTLEVLHEARTCRSST